MGHRLVFELIPLLNHIFPSIHGAALEMFPSTTELCSRGGTVRVLRPVHFKEAKVCSMESVDQKIQNFQVNQKNS